MNGDKHREVEKIDGESLHMNWREQLTVPNFLTLLRLLAIPFMVYYLYYIDSHPYTGMILFLLIWLTDMLDGFIARHYNQISDFGKLFDPAVDKIFHFTTGVALCLSGRVPLWVPIFIAVKESMLAAGAFYMLKHQIVVYAHWIGKAATVLFVTAFAAMMVMPSQYIYLNNYIFILPVICSFLALLHYGRFYLDDRRQHHERNGAR